MKLKSFLTFDSNENSIMLPFPVFEALLIALERLPFSLMSWIYRFTLNSRQNKTMKSFLLKCYRKIIILSRHHQSNDIKPTLLSTWSYFVLPRLLPIRLLDVRSFVDECPDGKWLNALTDLLRFPQLELLGDNVLK